MTTLKHPAIPGLTKTVHKDAVEAWEAQGWVAVAVETVTIRDWAGETVREYEYVVDEPTTETPAGDDG